MIGQLVLALSILVGLHEFGHFAFAKLFKIRVDMFYIFFDFLFPMPGVMNFSRIPFRFKNRSSFGEQTMPSTPADRPSRARRSTCVGTFAPTPTSRRS